MNYLKPGCPGIRFPFLGHLEAVSFRSTCVRKGWRKGQMEKESVSGIINYYFLFLLNLSRWHWLIKLYSFQVYNSIRHHLYVVCLSPQIKAPFSPFSPLTPSSTSPVNYYFHLRYPFVVVGVLFKYPRFPDSQFKQVIWDWIVNIPDQFVTKKNFQVSCCQPFWHRGPAEFRQ